MAMVADNPLAFAAGAPSKREVPPAVAVEDEVPGGGNPEGSLFAADWRTARGTDVATALTDGGKFNNTSNTDPAFMEVVSAAGLDFPAGMSNVLRIRRNGDGNSCDVRADARWNVPAIGEKLFVRIYQRNDIANDVGDQIISHHPFAFDAGVAATLFNFWFDSRADGTQRYRFNIGGDVSPNNRVIAYSGGEVLRPKFATYRNEMMFERMGTAEWKFELRIYNSANQLLNGPDTLYNSNGSQTLAARMAAEDWYDFDAAYTDKMLIGSSGGAWTFLTDQYFYWGGFMVRSDDWCGAY